MSTKTEFFCDICGNPFDTRNYLNVRIELDDTYIKIIPVDKKRKKSETKEEVKYDDKRIYIDICAECRPEFVKRMLSIIPDSKKAFG